MILEGTITKVVILPNVNAQNGNTYNKAEATLEVAAGNEYKDVINVTVLRPFDRVVGSWNDIIFNWSEPCKVKMTVAFKTHEYNGKTYQDINAVNCERI